MKLILIPLAFFRFVKLSFGCRIVNWRLKTNPKKWSHIYNKEHRFRIALVIQHWMLLVSGYKVSARNLDKLNDVNNSVIISNHKSYFEVPVLLKYFPKAVSWITKIEFYNNWLFGPILKAVRSFPIDRNDKKQTALALFQAARYFKKENCPIAIFPEGGRSKGQNMLPFKEDIIAFIMKLKANIIPIKIKYCYNKKNPDGSKNNKMELIVCDKIKYDSYKDKKVSQLTQELWNVIDKTV